jgi:hypothetical protein
MRTWLMPCLMLLPPAPVSPPPPAVPPQVAPPVPLGQQPTLPPQGTELPRLALPPPPEVPPDPTAHRHLGFFFRLDVGLGYLQSSTGSRSGSGVAAAFGFAVGGAVTENFILAGECWATANTPSQTVNGQTLNVEGASMGIGGCGLNLTHYLMPLNAYLSLIPAVTFLSLTTMPGAQGYPDVESSAGFGLKVALGKEWWVSDHWGVGLAVEFTFSTNKEQGTNPPNWTSFGGALTLSATYN